VCRTNWAHSSHISPVHRTTSQPPHESVGVGSRLPRLSLPAPPRPSVPSPAQALTPAQSIQLQFVLLWQARRAQATPREEDLRKGEGIRSGKHELGLRRLSLSSSNREIRRIPTIEDGLAAAGGQIRPPRRGGRQQKRLEGSGAAAVQGVGDRHLRPHRRHHRHFRGWYLFGSYLV
jgi:hypothetical protein